MRLSFKEITLSREEPDMRQIYLALNQTDMLVFLVLLLRFPAYLVSVALMHFLFHLTESKQD